MNAHCPYEDCDSEYECWDEDLAPSDEKIVTCKKCYRAFKLSAEVSVDYYSEKLDCGEQGVEHDYVYDPLLPVYPTNETCSKCGDMRG